VTYFNVTTLTVHLHKFSLYIIVSCDQLKKYNTTLKFNGPLGNFLANTAFLISQCWISQLLLYLFTFQRFIHVFYYCNESAEIFLLILLKTKPTYAAPKKVHSVKGPCFITGCANVTPFPDGSVFFLPYHSSIINHYAKSVLYKQQ
jgi:hypothetical protein